jgi:multidrug efflux pump subunit AcrB
MSPHAATVLAMQQVSGPVIAVAAVLSAVFVPCAFISGITGHFFRQFALTISVSTIISAFNSLTLSPALTALLLRPKAEQARAGVLPWFAFAAAGGWLGWARLSEPLAATSFSGMWPADSTPWVAAGLGALCGLLLTWPVNKVLGGMFWAFNRAFDALGIAYTWSVGKLLHVSVLVLVVYGGLVFLTYQQFLATPKGFIPSQDMGYLLVSLQLPDSASEERTAAASGNVPHRRRLARLDVCRALACQHARSNVARPAGSFGASWYVGGTDSRGRGGGRTGLVRRRLVERGARLGLPRV